MAVVCIGIGSNLGDRRNNLDRAVELVSGLDGIRLLARSGYVETAPEGGPPGQPDFLNGAIVVEADLPPRRLLAELQRIEGELGRPAPSQRGPLEPRTIDLDILLYDTLAVSDGQLTIPHPRMHLRRFVLEPLAEVAPQARHPLLGATVAEMLSWLAGPKDAT